MKEATGEISGSLIVVLAVALLSALFFTFIWPLVKDNLTNVSTCANAVCDWGYNTNWMAYCINPADTSAHPEVFECPYRG